MDPLYFDHHATTPVDPRVLEAMIPWLSGMAGSFGNPDSRSHRYGRAAREAVETARAQVAQLIGSRPDEIVFTSSATESNALALQAAPRTHVVTQATEHRAVLEHVRALEEHGVAITILDVDTRGQLDRYDVERALRPDTRMVSIMLANNEIGTTQPVDSIAAACDAHGVAFHVDAAQGVGYLPLDVGAMPIDLVSLSSHKMYGPQGVGALFVRRFGRAKPTPILRGGGQERGMRSGTSNVPGIVGFGRAAELMHREGRDEAVRLRALRDALATRWLAIEGAERHGHATENHPANLSIGFRGISADRLLTELEPVVALSTGSACSSGGRPSHVLLAIGLDDEARRATIRVGIGRSTTAADVERVAGALEAAVRSIRGALDAPASRS
jgi:cysteine desulfurase